MREELAPLSHWTWAASYGPPRPLLKTRVSIPNRLFVFGKRRTSSSNASEPSPLTPNSPLSPLSRAPQAMLEQQQQPEAHCEPAEQLDPIDPHLDAVFDARDYVSEFVREGWESHWDSIRITCDIPIHELRGFGNLDAAPGTAACKRLVQVPVINDEIGHALWCHLVEQQRGSGSLEQDRQLQQDLADSQAEEFMKNHELWLRHGWDEPRAAEEEAGKGRRRSFWSPRSGCCDSCNHCCQSQPRRPSRSIRRLSTDTENGERSSMPTRIANLLYLWRENAHPDGDDDRTSSSGKTRRKSHDSNATARPIRTERSWSHFFRRLSASSNGGSEAGGEKGTRPGFDAKARRHSHV
ncbi:uncharacterized protein E0L32_004413 [Thyridium curvatum]|uniref:Uncharacterized protein n=1 Tax=Thyridium curvatum TaxID=1093900 RepID=A0A507B6X0_9PEZI|nr:uncharacterized protein E0L32_004413 [Thyridium curvatum]TPX15433.1 hypothetical protein E0L32_004413 [Thyridium curvatum]